MRSATGGGAARRKRGGGIVRATPRPAAPPRRRREAAATGAAPGSHNGRSGDDPAGRAGGGRGGAKLAARLAIAAALPDQPEPMPIPQEWTREGVAELKRGLGRPRTWTEERLLDAVPAMLEQFADGASLVEACAMAGVPYDVMAERVKREPDANFTLAVKEGQRLAAAWWERQGRRNLTNPAWNNTLFIFQMANRFGYTRADGPGPVGATSGQSINQHYHYNADLSKLDTEELRTMRGLVAKATPGAKSEEG